MRGVTALVASVAMRATVSGHLVAEPASQEYCRRESQVTCDRRRRGMVRTCAALTAALTLGLCGVRSASGGQSLDVVSNRADLISGGDALVSARVSEPVRGSTSTART